MDSRIRQSGTYAVGGNISPEAVLRMVFNIVFIEARRYAPGSCSELPCAEHDKVIADTEPQNGTDYGNKVPAQHFAIGLVGVFVRFDWHNGNDSEIEQHVENC